MNSGTKGLIIGIMGALGVILGAFGAHALKERLPVEQLTTYQTGVTYHFYHVLAMGLAFLLFIIRESNKWAHRAFYCYLIGIIFFSGSIYLLSTRSIIGLDNYKWLGPITPLGGVLFILGWIFLGIALAKKE